LRPKKECPKKMIDAMNKIVSDNNNPIDAIFVYDVINKVMLYQTENSTKPGTLLKYNLKSIVKSFSSIGRLKRDILEFDDGIAISYLVKNSSNLHEEAIFGFITTIKGENIGDFLYFCEDCLDDIKDSLIEEDNDSAGS